MEERNLDFEIPLTADQWQQLGQTAARLGPDDWGFDWKKEEEERIHVYMRDEEARGLWRDYLSEEGGYGDSEMEVAQFVFNDGRPYAHVEAPPEAQKPVIVEQAENAMQVGMERFVREKWDLLMRESGLHYTRGHVPTDLPQPE